MGAGARVLRRGDDAMSVFDRRHRWGPVVRDGVFIRRTCSACGRTDSYETLIPDVVIDALLRYAMAPNPYRAILAVR